MLNDAVKDYILALIGVISLSGLLLSVGQALIESGASTSSLIFFGALALLWFHASWWFISKVYKDL